MILIIVLYALYASIFVIGKFAITISGPIFLTGVRMTCAGIISYGLHTLLYKNKIQLKDIKKFDWFILFLLALFNVYITNAGEFWALQYLPAGKTSFIYNISPFFVLIFSSLLFAERITFIKLIGMIIGFLSMMPILMAEQTTDLIDTTYHLGWLSLAEFIMLCAAAATALGWTIMKFFMQKEKFTPYFLNGVSLTIGGIMCLLHATFFEKYPFIISGKVEEFFVYMSSMMFIQNIIAYNLHAYLLRKYTATLIALISFVMPLITLLMSNALLGEPITPIFFAASCGVALGLYIFYKEELKTKT